MHRADVVLHIDRNYKFTVSMAKRLEQAGIQAFALNDASKWEESILHLDAGIILLDLDTPTSQGEEILEKIRNMDGDRRVILLTDSLSTTSIINAMAVGVDFCFLKAEAGSAELIDAIRALQFRRFHWSRVARLVGDQRRAMREAGDVVSDSSNSDLTKTGSWHPAPAANDLLSGAFAKFLLDTGRVPLDSLLKAVEYCDRQRPLLGQIALQMGRLDVKQIFQIVGDQSVSHEPFGKVAVRLGYLTPDDVDMLLKAQRDSRPDVSAGLTKLGLVTPERLTQFQEDFQRFAATLRTDVVEKAAEPLLVTSV